MHVSKVDQYKVWIDNKQYWRVDQHEKKFYTNFHMKNEGVKSNYHMIIHHIECSHDKMNYL